jgi:hypothetical protein
MIYGETDFNILCQPTWQSKSLFLKTLRYSKFMEATAFSRAFMPPAARAYAYYDTGRVAATAIELFEKEITIEPQAGEVAMISGLKGFFGLEFNPKSLMTDFILPRQALLSLPASAGNPTLT